MAQAAKPAIFLDRDGTLNIDYGYVHDIDHFHFIEGAIEACKKLKQMGFALILITNQAGIARGKFSEEQFLQLTEWMDWSLSDRGVDLDGIYYCPHHPDHGNALYRKACDCRKPEPGMLLAAKKDLNIDMMSSWMVGDKLEDLQAGRAAGVGTTVLVKTGKPVTDMAQQTADIVIESLADLPALITSQKGTKS
ncbi:MAG: D-glycero-beta-D-manno-heptose 1,7-bisphosphate 7-phosphatase [Enterobacteriaceae bacterium]